MELHAVIPTRMGDFTLSVDSVGLCRIAFPKEHPPSNLENLVEPAAHPLLAEAGRQLLAYLEGSLREFQLPLSIQGTLFQMRVWDQLRTIPYGETMGYGELGERIGGRCMARAVGGAAHANPLAIVIPCHRLIGAGGALTGFGGGLEMKQFLLTLEGQAVKKQASTQGQSGMLEKTFPRKEA